MADKKMILATCPICLVQRSVRADGAGKLCRTCRANENHKSRKPINIVGLKSGKLTVIEFSHKDKSLFWKCLCECGNSCVIQGYRLKSNKTRSCGCIVATKDGLSTSGTYRSWKAMLARCYDSNNNRYKIYGGRGIGVCNRWRDSFNNFLLDMGERPDGFSLDRIDNEKSYSIDNCQWVSVKSQANNRRNNFLITHKDKSLTLKQWSEQTGINPGTIRKRIVDLGWSLDKALSKKKK